MARAPHAVHRTMVWVAHARRVVRADEDHARPQGRARGRRSRTPAGPCARTKITHVRRVETEDEIVARLRAALDRIDADRLMAAPDCGLIMLGAELARAKLGRLVEAAHAV